ncbi:hypothetical protein J538_1167 [Acinetobacter sp. 272263]|nr:hypothetical protein J538_1167 [Acinetobacter sp. 272263]
MVRVEGLRLLTSSQFAYAIPVISSSTLSNWAIGQRVKPCLISGW